MDDFPDQPDLSLPPLRSEFVNILLADRTGAVLLQLRDGLTRRSPHRWCLPGGHCQPGEAPEEAAIRELYEESALHADSPLLAFGRQDSPAENETTYYYYGWTSATQDDVVVGEGAAMVFVPPDRLFVARRFTPGVESVLVRFLASPEYARAIRSA